MAIYIRRKKNIKECMDGGVSAPISTLSNTGGVGNAVPAQMAATTAADQCNPNCFGSGDNFGGSFPMSTQQPKKKKRKYRVKRR